MKLQSQTAKFLSCAFAMSSCGKFFQRIVTQTQNNQFEFAVRNSVLVDIVCSADTPLGARDDE